MPRQPSELDVEPTLQLGIYAAELAG